MSKNETKKIDICKSSNYVFEQITECCPEQYYVYRASSTTKTPPTTSIAYVRIRFGELTVQCPDAGGKMVYNTIIGEHLAGSVGDINEYACDILEAIENYYLCYNVSKEKPQKTVEEILSEVAPAPIVLRPIMPSVAELSGIVNELTEIAGGTSDVKKEEKKKGKENKKEIKRGVKLNSKKDPSRDVPLNIPKNR